MTVYTYAEMGTPSYFISPKDKSFIDTNDIEVTVVTPKYMALWNASTQSFIKDTEFPLINVAVFLVDVHFGDASVSIDKILGTYSNIKRGTNRLGESSMPVRTFIMDDGYEYAEWKIQTKGLAYYPEGLWYLTLVNYYADSPDPVIVNQIGVRLTYDYIPPTQPEAKLPEWLPMIPTLYDVLAGFGIALFSTHLMKNKFEDW
ncbi:MAG: hypothetical protein KKA81_16000 [Bacteroidetes bacterium]|nr:hypothetical protein [Bacteroidota bacterium]